MLQNLYVELPQINIRQTMCWQFSEPKRNMLSKLLKMKKFKLLFMMAALIPLISV